MYCARHLDTPALHAIFDDDSSAGTDYKPLWPLGQSPLDLSRIPNVAYELLPCFLFKAFFMPKKTRTASVRVYNAGCAMFLECAVVSRYRLEAHATFNQPSPQISKQN
jgi:hypothetical protein